MTYGTVAYGAVVPAVEVAYGAVASTAMAAKPWVFWFMRASGPSGGSGRLGVGARSGAASARAPGGPAGA
ncbi:hypothetical protein GCM10010389_30690 [Streptomyces echinoruber]|uniref:Uncharacterized protein n=1 Tax=Streptomyces echinoruber TaxID=68898 RepID=A0A918RAZ6_9ACTN|nr:hypothetical protein GCM10010389_30690 [Streptomyces echinoruber]